MYDFDSPNQRHLVGAEFLVLGDVVTHLDPLGNLHLSFLAPLRREPEHSHWLLQQNLVDDE